MLEGACVGYARAVQADLLLAKGLLIEEPIFNKDGDQVGMRVKTHEAVAISNSAWKQVKAFCSEFGLSPVSRTRLALEKQDTGQDLMAMLSAPREPKKPQVQ